MNVATTSVAATFVATNVATKVGGFGGGYVARSLAYEHCRAEN